MTRELIQDENGDTPDYIIHEEKLLHQHTGFYVVVGPDPSDARLRFAMMRLKQRVESL